MTGGPPWPGRGAYHVGSHVAEQSVYADYRQPIVHVMRRRLARVGADPANAKGKGPGCPDDLADEELLAEALERTPEVFCTDLSGDTCQHPRPTREEFTPPRYRRPAVGGLW